MRRGLKLHRNRKAHFGHHILTVLISEHYIFSVDVYSHEPCSLFYNNICVLFISFDPAG